MDWDGMPARAEAGTGSGTKLRVYCCEKQDGAGSGAGDQITGQAAGSERPETGRDAGGDRGLGRDKMPAGAEAGTGRDAEDQINSKESAL